MALAPGTRLGPYEILATAGAGGMGEVYRARDTRLDRTVAIKVLPEPVMADPMRRQRLEREARAVSKLNHPHICVLFDVGHQDGLDFLVMEYLEGETLEERLRKGPLTLAQLWRCSLELAGALDTAHENGIIHRDLKPGNVMLTRGGAKLLDFGLARPASESRPEAAMSEEPTRAAPLTREGAVIGTAPYMSPEQVEGKEVDARSDIFSFGSMLYEMATGRRAFTGKHSISVASAILEKEPEPMRTLQPTAPPALQHIIAVCLAKSPDDRWQSARDLLIELKWAAESVPQTAAGSPSPRKASVWIAWSLAILAVGAAIAVTLIRSPGGQPDRMRPLMRLSAELPPGMIIDRHLGAQLAMSPDGSRIVTMETDLGGEFVRYTITRTLGQSDFVRVPGETGYGPAFSPDGQWLAVAVAGESGGKLRKIPLQGGSPVTLCDVPNSFRGMSWGDDGQIVASFNNGTTGLVRVPSAGGKPEVLTRVDRQKGETEHAWPQVLPGSRAVLFTVYGPRGRLDPEITVLSLVDGTRKAISRSGDYGRYFPSGHLLYFHQDTMLAAPFDLSRLEMEGSPQPVLEGVNVGLGGGADFAFSQTGDAVYASSQGPTFDYEIQWLDASGQSRPLHMLHALYESPSLSPDGKRLAFEMASGPLHGDIWIKDLGRETLSRLTRLPGRNNIPVWTPDGQGIVFFSYGHDAQGIYWVRYDGTGEPQRLMEMGGDFLSPYSFSPDGKRLAYSSYKNGSERCEIWTVPIEGDRDHPRSGRPELFLSGDSFADGPAFSPDGRWLAYFSNESGGYEVYVRPFPGPGERVQVSTGGGTRPLWSPDGRRLYFLDGEARINVVDCSTTGASFSAGRPRRWSEKSLAFVGGNYPYTLAPDGKSFAVVLRSGTQDQPEQAPKDSVQVLLNFSEELAHKAPPSRKPGP
ncbi:MAG TPA: protein kinase [Candidatus Polarisedimenticolia bacterium]|nr:protein kinase [Candidatus Polarisedimenticolia bacterium]